MISFSLARSTPSSASFPRRRPLSERMEFGITIVLAVLGVLLASLSLLYLFYANAKATQDYHLRTLQEKRTALIQNNEVLAAQIAQLESLGTLEENEQIAAMITPEKLYLGESQYAQRDGRVAQRKTAE